jgi:protein arginine kinase
VQTLFQKTADWLAMEGPRSEVVVSSHICLVRNLMEFPFPGRFTQEESREVEQRIVHALESLGLLDFGQYFAVGDLSISEMRVLAERQLSPRDLTQGTHARGVYVANDQSLSVVVNGTDHLSLHGLGAGLQLDEVWHRVDQLDDGLLEELDTAFDERLGFLTSSLGQTGTGLKASVVLHVPVLLASGDPLAREWATAEHYAGLFGQRYIVERAFGPQSDYYRFTNWSSLGQNEEEILFHIHHVATELAGRELELREAMRGDAPRRLEDRVNRARGVARNARLLDYGEAVTVLSSLRLGAAMGLIEDSVHRIDELLITSQNAHLQLQAGRDCDEVTLNSARADLFRSRFP